MNDSENRLDPQLWHACAGGMVQMPPVNSRVFYFPQGHAEHASSAVDFPPSLRIAPLILCRVAAVKFLADSETDEVFSKVRLVPLASSELDSEDDAVVAGSDASPEKPTSFAKTLTQSDANNGGGFSVPRYCAETIFPRLDYSADPPVQTVVAKDVHGEVWKFRHIYRGTPRRHLLTTGWSTFVNQKKLVAGDSIVFLRAENGELCVGSRRSKRAIGGGSETPSGWSSSYGGFSVFLREDENKLMRNGSFGSLTSNGGLKGRVRGESVVEAASLAASGQPFEVVYYPRASTPEFCVKASCVRAAIRTQWCSGMRFKMPFETEDSSRISWFMGTIASVQVADHIRWPNSPWRLLQVTWDEPDLLRNVKCVSPWLVELVSNMPVIGLSPFSPPRKKLRHPDFFPHDDQFSRPSFTGNPLRPGSNAPAGIQGARQTHFGISLPDLHYTNKLQSGLFHPTFHRFDPCCKVSNGIITSQASRNDNLSCLLTMGSSSPKSEKFDNVKKHQFFLFGQRILTEQQMSRGSSDGNLNKLRNSSDDSRAAMGNLFSLEKSKSADFSWNQGYNAAELGVDTGHCKVFMESEDVGRTLDLSALVSYEELYTRLANMFGIEKSELLNHVLYRDALGTVRQAGDEPFSDFTKSAKRLTILMDSANNKLRTLITGMQNADNTLNSSNKRDPLSIFV